MAGYPVRRRKEPLNIKVQDQLRLGNCVISNIRFVTLLGYMDIIGRQAIAVFANGVKITDSILA